MSVPGKKAAPWGAAFLLLLPLILVACTGLERIGGFSEGPVEWAASRGFTQDYQHAGIFDLLVLKRLSGDDVLTAYIEGDGAAWLAPHLPPPDPTPVHPLALTLAAQDTGRSVAYLGRPCQYLTDAALRTCRQGYWTSQRFAPEVLTAYMNLLDRLKAETGARRLRLVGYSGGGVVATLLAGRRTDVEHLVTVAAPVAVAEWTGWHKVTPLHGSLDPLAEKLPLPPATHFSGADDAIVPPAIAERFVAAKGGKNRVVPGFDHQCCWARDWPRLLEETR